MKLLLDTHIWIWKEGSPDKLRKRVADAIEDRANELWLSPVSIWELSVLVEKGRIELNDDLDAWVSKALANGAVREAPLTNDVALAVAKLRFTHRDPADRFIAASAKVFDLTLVTADSRLLALQPQGIATLSNR